MQTQTQTKPSALNVRWLEDIIFLLKESEERWWKTPVREAYLEWKKRLEKLTYNKI